MNQVANEPNIAKHTDILVIPTRTDEQMTQLESLRPADPLEPLDLKEHPPFKLPRNSVKMAPDFHLQGFYPAGHCLAVLDNYQDDKALGKMKWLLAESLRLKPLHPRRWEDRTFCEERRRQSPPENAALDLLDIEYIE